jgi:hypothetical protein
MRKVSHSHKIKRKIMISVLILHSSAELHSVAHTGETLQELKSEVLGHPACSSYFHSF